MAVAYLAFGNIGKEAVLTTEFRSAELESGSNYTFTNVSGNYLVITATADIYVAFTTNGTVPQPTNINARIRVPSGSSMPFSITNGTRIGVVTA